MHWILQNNLFNEAAYQDLEDTLVRFNIPYSIHKVIPFIGELTPEPILDHDNVICMGSYSMRHYAKKRGWKPGVFDLELFDFRLQLMHWDTEMLNHDSVVCMFQDANFHDARFGDTTPEHLFIRPISDSKSFAGRVFSKEEFYDWKRKVCVLEHDYGDSLSKITFIQMCLPKEIYSEHRFWVVKGEIATCSTYKIGDKVIHKPENEVDERFKDYVAEQVSKWQPHEAFVIDVADTSEGLKIVEINTLNSAGFYAANMQKLVMALEDAFHTRRI